MSGITKGKTLALVLTLSVVAITTVIATITGCGSDDNNGGDRFTMYTLTTAVEPPNTGRVDRDPHATTYQNNTPVTLTANPAAGYRFAGWSDESLDQVTPVTITMTRDINITANFVSTSTPDGHTLTITRAPEAGGTASRSPDLTHYPAGTEVTVTATSEPDYTFAGWAGASDSTTRTVTITMDGDKELTAIFLPNLYTLTTSATGGGSVTRDPEQEKYAHNAEVKVTAKANPGYVFTRWTGATTLSTNPATIIMNGNKELNAIFELVGTNRYTLTTGTIPTDGAGGSVRRDPDENGYLLGTQVVLTANPAEGYRFKGWTGGLESENAVDTITIVGDMTVIAQFQRVRILTINRFPEDGGTVTPESGLGHDVENPVVNIVATPKNGYRFFRWTVTSGTVTIADTNSANTTVNLSTDATIIANFASTFTDPRNGQNYRIVIIGGKIWMAENLNYETGASWCYDNNITNCEKYGRLYNWDEAMTACPNGWRLPDTADWTNLLRVAGETYAGATLRSRAPNWNGTDELGFSALPGGYKVDGTGFYEAGMYGAWWSSTEYNNSHAWRMLMGGLDINYIAIGYINGAKAGGQSVRCIMND